jgi:membrane protein implicated in regulation of membrane protease activity
MNEATIWWMLAGLAIGSEMLTGTFYLLMVAFGLSAAGIAAHLGGTFTVQLVIAGLVGGSATLLWHRYKKSQPKLAASTNHDVNLDIGASLQIEHWAADRTATVKYRGAQWQVALAEGETAAPGTFTICEIVGSCLLVKKL